MAKASPPDSSIYSGFAGAGAFVGARHAAPSLTSHLVPTQPGRRQPIILPRHRHSTRIRGYDYTATGWYFVTICAMHRECLFGEVRDGSVVLSEPGRLAASCWEAIPAHFPWVELDDWVLMPNHLHGIVVIRPGEINQKITTAADVPKNPAVVGARHAAPWLESRLLNQDAFLNRSPTPRLKVAAGSLGAIMGSFKAASTKEVNRLRGFQGPSIWQRNYHDHVIRDTDELNRIRQYIRDNPREWTTDPENPDAVDQDGSS